MKSNLISLGQQFLIAMLAASGVQGLNTITPAEMQGKLTDGNVYIRKDITAAGGIVNLIDSSTLEKIGTSSFNGQKLPTGVKMAVERIRLGLAVVDAADTNPAAAQKYTNKGSATEAKFAGAHFILTKAGKKILEIPVSQFLTLDNCEGMQGEHDCYDLQAFRYLVGDEMLEIQLSFPDNVSWTNGKKIFVSVELLGPRAQA